MQVAVAAGLRQRTLDAFPPMEWPPAMPMFQPRYQSSLDADEMVAEFANRPWTEISRRTLFVHRDTIILLTAEAFLAYLPAYLMACLEPRDSYRGDLWGCTIGSLVEDPSRTIDDTRERTRLLDDEQRLVVAGVIGYIALWGRARSAWEALEAWRR